MPSMTRTQIETALSLQGQFVWQGVVLHVIVGRQLLVVCQHHESGRQPVVMRVFCAVQAVLETAARLQQKVKVTTFKPILTW